MAAWRCGAVLRVVLVVGGQRRAPGFDSDIYKQRNTIERSFSRSKQWRGIATRYDKYAVTYLGGFLLGMVILTHRADH